MSNDSSNKRIILTDEQATRAAEALINGWLRNDNDTNYSEKKPKKDKKPK